MRLRIVRSLLLVTVALWTGLPRAAADEPLQYNRDIRPILAENCFACHGIDGIAREADLRLDQREAAIEYGAITPGEPDASELLIRVLEDDPDLVMPPPKSKKRLTAEQKQMLAQWIREGAEYESHWALIAPVKSTPPAVQNSDWVKNEIDPFVLANLERQGLTPAPEADASQLFRRLHLDITGLPPKAEQVTEFVNDYNIRGELALSQWIDRLMQSSAWGEHRARYWLDAARYGDTHGMHFDNYREMWPYRDWVIRAMNANMPFDQFVVEQLAGDLLPEPTMDQLIATGFQRCNMTTNEGGTIDEENVAQYAADRVQTFGWVFLGLTTNCSQCHDHKFDPITAEDYYSLAAFFRNTTQGPKDNNAKDGGGPVIMVPSPQDRDRWEALPQEIQAATEKRDQRRVAANDDFQKWLAALTPATAFDAALEQNLVLRVPLNEGSGNEVKSTGSDSASFTASGPLEWAEGGILGPAAILKSSSTIDLGAIGEFTKDQKFSFGAWVKAVDATSMSSIIARMDSGNAYRGWDLWQNGSEFAVHLIDAWPDNALKVITQGNLVKPGQWQHVFVTWDGSGQPQGMRIYVDGKPQATRADTNTLKPEANTLANTSLRIGQRSEGQVFEGGSVQDFRLYDRELTAADVSLLAQAARLQQAVATKAEDRSDEQRAALLDHYLLAHDAEYPVLAASVANLESEREAIRARSPVTHVQVEQKDREPMAHILMRGAYDALGPEVQANTPAALHPMPPDAPRNRLGLAQWVIDPANPLTARVTVNRFWQEIFGQGIVTTSEDFGVMGTPPTHPELLDWLAVDFQQNGWDVKRLFKLMLMSATYRQATVTTPEKIEKDRDNGWFSRGPRFRMDAEMVRDYALAVSGLLSGEMYGPGTKPYQPGGVWDMVGLPGGDTRNYTQDAGENLYRRSLYNFWKRMAPPPNLEAFNAPNREVCTVRRERTNTPLQALVTLNDPQFVEASRHLAQRALHAAQDDYEIVQVIAQTALCRPLIEAEAEILLVSKDNILAHYASHPADAQALLEVGESPADASLEPARLAAWTMVCNQILNLDEVLNK